MRRRLKQLVAWLLTSRWKAVRKMAAVFAWHLMALPVRVPFPVRSDFDIESERLRTGLKRRARSRGRAHLRVAMVAAVALSTFSGVVLSPVAQAYVQITASSTFTPSQAAYRFFEDGNEAHGMCVANDGYLRHVPCQRANACYVSTPDNDSIVGDIEIVTLSAPWDYTEATLRAIVSHAGGANNLGWLVQWTTTGGLNYAWSPTGVAFSGSNTATAADFVAAGFTNVGCVPIWTKVTHTVNNGSGQNVVRWYAAAWDGVSTTEPGSWTLVQTATNAGTTTIFNTTAAVNISGYNGGTQMMSGKVFAAKVRDGIGGTLKYNFNPHADTTNGATSWTAGTTGETWTCNGTVNAPAALSTAVSRTCNTRLNMTLVIRVQEGGGKAGGTDWQLQSNVTGSYTNIAETGYGVIFRATPTMTNQAATTNQLGAGSGSYMAGLVSLDGLANNKQLTASNYTEFAFALQIETGHLPIGATVISFRLLVDGAVMTYTVTPQLTVTRSTLVTPAVPVLMNQYRQRHA